MVPPTRAVPRSERISPYTCVTIRSGRSVAKTNRTTTALPRDSQHPHQATPRNRNILTSLRASTRTKTRSRSDSSTTTASHSTTKRSRTRQRDIAKRSSSSTLGALNWLTLKVPRAGVHTSRSHSTRPGSTRAKSHHNAARNNDALDVWKRQTRSIRSLSRVRYSQNLHSAQPRHSRSTTGRSRRSKLS